MQYFALLESVMHAVHFCFKTPARIKITYRKVTFCALVHAGSHLHFLSQRDLEDAQDTFSEKCEILSKTNGNSSNRTLYDILKHANIQNPTRIISKIETSDFAQFDRLPRAPNWPFMHVPTLPLKAQRGSTLHCFRHPNNITTLLPPLVWVMFSKPQSNQHAPFTKHY